MRLINYLLENKRVELMIKDKDDDDQKSFNKNMLSNTFIIGTDFNKIKREQTLILGIRMGDLFLHASISYQINDAKDMDVIIIYLRENGAEINVKDRDEYSEVDYVMKYFKENEVEINLKNFISHTLIDLIENKAEIITKIIKKSLKYRNDKAIMIVWGRYQ
ncbi:hypothetical protein U3516DRAFT_783109 [Neocallimastix sp. 'constans']